MLPILNSSPKDPDIRYLKKNSDKLLTDLYLFFDIEPEQTIQKIKPEFLGYMRYEYTTGYSKPNLIKRLMGHEPQNTQKHISHYIVSENFKDVFFENKALIGIWPMTFFTSQSEIIEKLFDIQIDENKFAIPLKEQMGFEPKTVLETSYFSLKQANVLSNYYFENKKIFENNKLKYFGFVSIEGTDCPELSEVLERLDDKYDIYNDKTINTRVFMTNFS